METLFTRIINREIPADIVYEDDKVVAFRDIAPVAPVHIVLVTRDPIAGVSVVQPGGQQEHLIYAARMIAEQLGLGNGYRLIINQGFDGGQTVDHLHVHLLGGRALDWPPG